MLRFLIVLVILAIAYPSYAEEVCGPQNYDSRTAPNFDCPGPDESTLSLSLDAPRSIPVYPGYVILAATGEEVATITWEGAIVHRNRLIETGLRVKAVRRLRWADRLRLTDTCEIRLRYANDLNNTRIELLQERVDDYQAHASAARERVSSAESWWRAPALWFAVGFVSAGAVVALTAYGLSAAGD